MEGEKFKVKLRHEHEHGGEKLAGGTTIEVYPHTANWLIERGIAEKLSEPLPSKSAVKGGVGGGSK